MQLTLFIPNKYIIVCLYVHKPLCDQITNYTIAMFSALRFVSTYKLFFIGSSVGSSSLSSTYNVWLGSSLQASISKRSMHMDIHAMEFYLIFLYVSWFTNWDAISIARD